MSTSYLSITGNALVTGAASGMGKAIAVTYAKAGAAGVYLADLNVVNIDRAVAEVKRAATNPNFKVHGAIHDVRDKKSVDDMIHNFKEIFGRLDYAVNFAAIAELPDTVTTLDAKVYDKILATNERGVFLCTRAELQLMDTQEAITTLADRVPQKGAIVNAASLVAFLPLPGNVAYNVSKNAVVGITRSAASTHNNTSGIRINCVCPGVINTPLLANEVLEEREFLVQLAKQERFGQPEEVADVVVFLTSPNASFINGQAWCVDNEDTLKLLGAP